jgi:hypothetical protein
MQSFFRFLGISLEDYFILYENEEKQLFIQYKLTNYELSKFNLALPYEVLTEEVLKKYRTNLKSYSIPYL